MTKDKFTKRREYVNKEFSKQVTGKKVSKKQKTKLFKRLWRMAKRKFK